MFSRLTILAGLVAVGLTGCARFEDKPLSAAASAERLEARSLSDTNFKAFLETNLHRTFADWPLTNWDFPALTLAAFYFHPSLDVARAQWAVARGGETTAGARPNPVLGVTPGYSGNPAKGVSPWFPSVTLDVPIETAGKRGYRQAHAAQLSEAARLNIAIAAWQVRSGVRVALDEYTAARARASGLERIIEHQKKMVLLLEQRLGAGAISGAELVPGRISLAKLRVDLAEAERLSGLARGKIAESIGLPWEATRDMYFPARINVRTNLSLEAGDFSVPLVRRAALQGRADVQAALAEYAATQSALQLEIAKQYPDLHLNPGYQWDQGENKWTLGLSVELPVLYRNQGGIAEAKAKRNEAAARFTALQLKVIAQVDQAVLGCQLAKESYTRLFEVFQVQSQESKRLQEAFKLGGADRMEVVGADLEFETALMAFVEADQKKRQSYGTLEDALQQPFDGLDTVERDPKLQAAKDQ